MLTTALLPLLIAVNAQMPTQHDLDAAKSVNFIKWAAEHRTEVIAPAQSGLVSPGPVFLGRRQEPGTDHGDDPNDETHDGDLPANAHKRDGYPSRDPYAGSTSNGRQPWLDPPE
jgi:hypothetical protein